MLNKKKYLLPITGALIATINLAAPVLAANQIVITKPDSGKKYLIHTAALEQFAKTGDKSGFPLDLSDFLFGIMSPEELQKQLTRPISIDPNLPLNPKSFEAQLLNNLMPPNSTEAERQAALTLMAAKGNGQILIDFLKAIPGETITPDNFLQILTAYQVPAIKPPNPEPEPKPEPEPEPGEPIPVQSVPEPASTVSLLGFGIWAGISKLKRQR